MAQHVRVDRERQFGLPTGTLDQPIETGAIERRAALIDEDVCRPELLLLLQPAQRPQFSAVERTYIRSLRLGSLHGPNLRASR